MILIQPSIDSILFRVDGRTQLMRRPGLTLIFLDQMMLAPPVAQLHVLDEAGSHHHFVVHYVEVHSNRGAVVHPCDFLQSTQHSLLDILSIFWAHL